MLIARKTVGQGVLWALLAVVLYFCFRILQPFLMPIFLALILSTLLAPLYNVLLARLKGRRSLSAFLICLGLTVAILLPVLFLISSLASAATDAYQQLKDPQTLTAIQSWLDPANNPVLHKLSGWLPSSFRLENLQLGAKLGALAQEVGIVVLGVATKFATGVVGFLGDYLIMAVVLFFLLRDAAYFADSIKAISPLSPEDEARFVDRFRTVTRATVLGNLLTSLTQGGVSGLIFLFMGLPNPMMWGVLTALLSLVPLVGTALVWVPWTIYLFAIGSPIKAVIFVVLQVVAVGGIDNILRPIFMGSGVNMHTLLLFFSILGGVAYFGILGMVIGPLIFSVALALLEVMVSPRPLEAVPPRQAAR
jgi:predicted PurR-regulated permease PerM